MAWKWIQKLLNVASTVLFGYEINNAVSSAPHEIVIPQPQPTKIEKADTTNIVSVCAVIATVTLVVISLVLIVRACLKSKQKLSVKFSNQNASA